jgi:diacylglycerol O-acyltransferase
MKVRSSRFMNQKVIQIFIVFSGGIYLVYHPYCGAAAFFFRIRTPFWEKLFFKSMKSALESVYSSASLAVSPGSGQRSEFANVRVTHSLNEKTKPPGPDRIRSRLSLVHMASATSLLATADRVNTGDKKQVNFRGILNLFFIILFVLNVRLVVENIIRYGSLLQFPRIDFFNSPTILLGYGLVLALPYLSFVAERYVALRSRQWANAMEVGLIVGTLTFPYMIVISSPVHPLRSLMLLMASVVYAMKIGSYWHCCCDLHKMWKNGELKDLDKADSACECEAENHKLASKYPECLTVSQMYMYIAFPTLVFQLWYPRTSEVRIKIVLRYLAELLFCVILQFILIEQYITPILTNAITGVEERIAKKDKTISLCWFLLERLLKLSIPNLYIWLLMFAELFHCWLNILAELSRFGDRKFYLDWWNAVSIRDYWQKWNLPVHYWLLRHFYKPMRKSGISAFYAGLLIFVFSGIVHEYLIITPIGVSWSGLVSAAFILQIPLISVTDSIFVKNRPTLGNCLFWIFLCFTGQPLATLIHFVAASSPTVLPRLFQWVTSGTSHDEF